LTHHQHHHDTKQNQSREGKQEARREGSEEVGMRDVFGLCLL